jgi:hypothetical protein
MTIEDHERTAANLIILEAFAHARAGPRPNQPLQEDVKAAAIAILMRALEDLTPGYTHKLWSDDGQTND